MEKFILECEEQYDDKLSDYRAIDRYVWYQIKQMIDNDLQLGRIIKIDNNGILGVNTNSKLLTDEQKKYIDRLIGNERDGIYRIHQFKDLKRRLKSVNEYNKWLDEKAMNSFMHTIPTKEVFYNNPLEYYYHIKDLHSYYELNRQDFNGYSIWQTLYALDIIDPFLVGMLLGGEIEVVEPSTSIYIFVKFNYKGKDYYAKRNSNELFEMDENGKLIKLNDTTHTLLFKHYQEPIFKTLNSIMYPIGGQRVMPSEGEYEDPKIFELTSNTKAILESENYKKLSKIFEIGQPKIR